MKKELSTLNRAERILEGAVAVMLWPTLWRKITDVALTHTDTQPISFRNETKTGE